MAANGVQLISVVDTDLTGAVGEFGVFTINPASAGSAQFTANGAQALVCLNGAACDTGAAVGSIVVSVTGTGTVGAVVVNITLQDFADGVFLAGNVSDTASVAWTQVLPASAATVSAALPASISGAAGSPGTAIIVQLTDSAGALILGVPVTVSSTIGDVSADVTGTTCATVISTGTIAVPIAGVFGGPPIAGSDGACVFASTGAGTGDTVFLFGDDVFGVSTVTITALGTTFTQQVNLYGPAANVTVAITALSSNRIAATGGATSLTLTATDANGIPVPSVLVSARVDPAVAAADALAVPATCTTLAVAVGLGTCAIAVTENATAGASPEGTQTVQVSLLAGALFATTDSIDIELVGPIAMFAFVSQTPAGTIPVLGTVAVAFLCTTAGGLDCLAGAAIAGPFATGAGIVVAPAPAIGAAGMVTVNLVTEDQAGNTVLVRMTDAATGLIVGTHTVTAQGAGAGSFSPPIAAQGQTFTSYSGGTVAQLILDLDAADATSATATLADGSTVTVIVTTLGIVNTEFNAAFPGGVPAGTILAVRSVN